VVGGITNVRVWETIPDKVFDAADEVVLVDIPADELLARLKAGKVYVAHQAEHAAHHFFRKGNLMALRELALRRTADRVEGDVQAYRVDRSIESVWKTATALLTCVGPDAAAERVVRAAARLAGQLNTEWHAIYVETPNLQRLAAAKREKILANLNLARPRRSLRTRKLPRASLRMHARTTCQNSSSGVTRSGACGPGKDPAARSWPCSRPT
jgi:two-component system sensor histidine kinase KdpD